LVNTAEYENFPELGEITKIENVILREHLGDNVENWKDSVNRFPDTVTTRQEKEDYLEARLEDEVLVIYFDVSGAEYNNFFTIPKTQGGYQQSNLRKIKQLNSFPDRTEDWVGKKAKIIKNDAGFPALAK
jgi:hypothetical protein